MRGINVGKAKRVAMADLRALLADLGFSDVRTLLNSGNAVFDATTAKAAGAAGRIEDALLNKTGVAARVTVLSAAELGLAVTENPLSAVAADPARFLVAFLNDAADRKHLEPLGRQRWSPEAFALGKRVAYLWCAEGILASRLAQAVGRALGDGVTSRNWATILKLQALLEA